MSLGRAIGWALVMAAVAGCTALLVWTLAEGAMR
jgi:hypothetical protein